MAVLRKTVTVLFCDVADSTPLGERLDPEVLQRVMSRYHASMKTVLERHGGTVEKFIGDAVMAVFGIPTVHDDDALRAVRAASEMRTALAELNEELERDFGVQISVCTGLNTGEVVAGDHSSGQAFATGHAVVVAERLQKAARGGEILLGESTRRLVENAALVEPLEALKVKGKTDAVEAWRLIGVLEGAPPFARRLDTPMVGRENELAQLRTAFDEAVRDRAARLVTIVGQAGIGKSRLANELLASAGAEASVLVGRCLPYGEGITYWPLRDVLRDAAGDLTQARIEELLEGEEGADRIAARVAGTIGVGETSGGADETLFAVRRLFERLAGKQPLIVGFDDLQWAEPTFLDLIEYLVRWSRDAPILFVCLARPELLDKHPTWLAVKPNATSIMLEPLSEEEAESLLERLRGNAELGPEVLERITQAAEGNPLFVEQMLAMMTEEDGAFDATAIPPSIHALLAARLDRLPPEERAVLERASVIGKEFWRGAIVHLSDDGEGSLGPHMMALVRKDLIEPSRSIFPWEDAFRFRHILIRDAAYLSIPKETRAALHERYADWLEQTAGERANELEEILGYHLEQSYRYRDELGPVGERGAALAARAGERLGAAGRRAIIGGGDIGAAANLVSRAVALLPPEHSLRGELLAELASALMMTGDFKHAGDVIGEALSEAVAAGDARLEARALIEQEFHKAFAGSADVSSTIPEVTARAIPVLEAAGDDLGLARAWRLKSEVAVRACRWGERAEALERALEHAQLAGDRREQSTLVALLAFSLYYGPTPVEEAIFRCEHFLTEVSGDVSLEAAIGNILAGLRAMRGDFEEARRLWSEARKQYDELGLRARRAARSIIAADIETLAGDDEAAERELRSGYETLERMGEKGARASIAAILGESLCKQRRDDEAERFAEITKELAPSDDLVSQVLWRSVQAKVLARRGRLDEAEELAREAAVLVETTDFPYVQTLTYLSLAEVLETAGKTDEAEELIRRAQTLCERKGNVVAGRRIVRNANTTGRSS